MSRASTSLPHVLMVCSLASARPGMRAGSLLLALAVATSACGGSSAESPDGDVRSPDAGSAADGGNAGDGGTEADAGASAACLGSDPDFEAFHTCYVEALCERAVACESTFADVEACMQNPPLPPAYAEVRDLHSQQGLAELDAERALECVEGLRAEPCRAPVSSCSVVLQGTVADEQGCFRSAECESTGAICNKESSSCGAEQCCAGRCEAKGAAGEACPEAGCQPGLACVDGTCSSGDEGAACAEHRDCRSPFWCRDGACTPDFVTGQHCDDDAQCPGDEDCVGDDLDTQNTGTCGPVASEGDPCDTAGSRLGGGCLGDLYCDLPDTTQPGACEALPNEEGEECENAPKCAGSQLYCRERDGEPDLCSPLPGEGEPCVLIGFRHQCAPGLFCSVELGDDAPGTCRTPQPDAEPCNEHHHCESGLCAEDGEGDEVCEAITTCR